MIRTCVLLPMLVSALGYSAANAQQPYPATPISMIVGFAPGGGTDLVARIIGQKMNESWGQPVLVDNRAGATGTIGADLVAKLRQTATRC